MGLVSVIDLFSLSLVSPLPHSPHFPLFRERERERGTHHARIIVERRRLEIFLFHSKHGNVQRRSSSERDLMFLFSFLVPNLRTLPPQITAALLSATPSCFPFFFFSFFFRSPSFLIFLLSFLFFPPLFFFFFFFFLCFRALALPRIMRRAVLAWWPPALSAEYPGYEIFSVIRNYKKDRPREREAVLHRISLGSTRKSFRTIKHYYPQHRFQGRASRRFKTEANLNLSLTQRVFLGRALTMTLDYDDNYSTKRIVNCRYIVIIASILTAINSVT